MKREDGEWAKGGVKVGWESGKISKMWELGEEGGGKREKGGSGIATAGKDGGGMMVKSVSWVQRKVGNKMGGGKVGNRWDPGKCRIGGRWEKEVSNVGMGKVGEGECGKLWEDG